MSEEKNGLTVLLAEDDRSIRDLIANQLKRSGHRVLAAENGEEALRLAAEYEGTIDFLVTDYVMPWMSGPELVVALERTRPDTGIIFMSSFVPDASALPATTRNRVTFIAKPFRMSELKLALEMIR